MHRLSPVPENNYGLGQALSQGLQVLANNKLSKLHQRNTVLGLQHALGFSPQEAQGLALLPQHYQEAILQNFLQRGGLGQQQENGFDQLNNGLQDQSSTGFDQLAENTIQPQDINTLSQSNRENVVGPYSRVDNGPQNMLRSATDLKLKPTNDATSGSLTKALQRPFLSKESQKQRHYQSKQLEAQQKQNRPEYKKILEDLSAANDEDRDISQLEKLIERGNLPNPTWHSILNSIEKGIFGIGVNLKSLEHADAQQYDKTLKRFLRGAKAQLGGGVLSDSDIRVFLDQYPDLTKSDEGKYQIIQSMKALNEMKRVTARTAEQIVKKNKGIIPSNLKHLSEEAAKPQLDKLRREFIDGTYGSPYKKPSEVEKLKQVLTGDRSFFSFGSLAP